MRQNKPGIWLLLMVTATILLITLPRTWLHTEDQSHLIIRGMFAILIVAIFYVTSAEIFFAFVRFHEKIRPGKHFINVFPKGWLQMKEWVERPITKKEGNSLAGVLGYTLGRFSVLAFPCYIMFAFMGLDSLILN